LMMSWSMLFWPGWVHVSISVIGSCRGIAFRHADESAIVRRLQALPGASLSA